MPQPEIQGRTILCIDARNYAKYFALWGWLTGGLAFLDHRRHESGDWGIAVTMLTLIGWIIFGIGANWVCAYVFCALANFKLMLIGGVTYYTKEAEPLPRVTDASMRVRQMMRDPE